MRVPTREKSEVYYLTQSEHGVVHLTDSGRFKVAIWPNETLLPNEKFRVTVRDDNSFEFDSIEEVKEYLLEMADEDHKDQFHE